LALAGFAPATIQSGTANAAPADGEAWSSEVIRLEEVQLSQSEVFPPDQGDRLADEEGGWSGTFELYGYLPLQTNAYNTIRGTEADASISLQDLLDALEFAAAARATVEKGRFGLLLDADYVRIGDEQATVVGPRQGLSARSSFSYTQGFYDLALRYRFGPQESAVGKPGQFTFIPYAGARLVDLQWDLDLALEVERRRIEGPFGRRSREIGGQRFDLSRSASRTWVQPLVGATASWFLSPRLRAFGRADIAGFDLAGEDDISYNLQAGLGYAVGNNTDLNLSWRTRGLSWNDGGDPDNGYRAYNYGIELGLKFFFGGARPAVRTATNQLTPEPEPEPLPVPGPEPMMEPVRGLW
jgi:hypothetical protein